MANDKCERWQDFQRALRRNFEKNFYNLVKNTEMVSFYFRKHCKEKKEKLFGNFDFQNVNPLCSHHYYVNSSFQFSVSIEFYRSLARALLQEVFKISLRQKQFFSWFTF